MYTALVFVVVFKEQSLGLQIVATVRLACMIHIDSAPIRTNRPKGSETSYHHITAPTHAHTPHTRRQRTPVSDSARPCPSCPRGGASGKSGGAGHYQEHRSRMCISAWRLLRVCVCVCVCVWVCVGVCACVCARALCVWPESVHPDAARLQIRTLGRERPLLQRLLDGLQAVLSKRHREQCCVNCPIAWCTQISNNTSMFPSRRLWRRSRRASTRPSPN